MKKVVKFGLINIPTTKGRKRENHTYKVMITEEFDKHLVIIYGEHLNGSGDVYGLPSVVDKNRVYDMYEKNLNWIQRMYIKFGGDF